jgi:hypothetical protein
MNTEEKLIDETKPVSLFDQHGGTIPAARLRDVVVLPGGRGWYATSEIDGIVYRADADGQAAGRRDWFMRNTDRGIDPHRPVPGVKLFARSPGLACGVEFGAYVVVDDEPIAFIDGDRGIVTNLSSADRHEYKFPRTVRNPGHTLELLIELRDNARSSRKQPASLQPQLLSMREWIAGCLAAWLRSADNPANLYRVTEVCMSGLFLRDTLWSWDNLAAYAEMSLDGSRWFSVTPIGKQQMLETVFGSAGYPRVHPAF